MLIVLCLTRFTPRMTIILLRFTLSVCYRRLPDFATGFYRVNYDNDNWRQLVLQMNSTHREIHVLNRAQLIDDSLNLARAGLLDYAIALDLSTYLNHEDDYIPWYAAMECLSYVVERMRRSDEGYEYIKVSYHGFRLIVRFLM